ncbi:MAG: molybdopterin molybdotransferase MoeA [Ardenticatenia bacterium]|nr:molybdopterin molybdotransferase MoeA [Ardenticatenia bacterium]
MISVEQAQEHILAHIGELDAEPVPLFEAVGRVLAEDIVAEHNIPPFRNSAMDGYAVRAADTDGASPERPILLRVVETVAAGTAPTAPVVPGTAARIMTGAPMPPGADAVVRFEETSEALPAERRPPGGHIAILRPVRPGDNVREAGEDVSVGQTALRRGQRLRAAEVGLLAALGRSRVTCVRRPRVGVLATGDELVGPEEPLTPGKIRNSNEYTNVALVRLAGGLPVPLGIARDNVKDLSAKLKLAVEAGVDLLITSAGVSVGDYDVVKHVLAAQGEVHFWQVAIKPGKPLAFGTLEVGGRPVPLLGLPGNPVAAFVAFEVFARPAIRKMAGLRPLFRRRFRARLQEDVTNSGRRHYMRARVWRDDASGQLHATTRGSGVRVQGSGILSSLVWANGFVIVPEQVTFIPAGEPVDVELFDWPEEVF